MLLQFSVTNYRSIKKTATISMLAASDKTMKDCLLISRKTTLVPVIALYGANAAGKTNLLDALFLMREMICGQYAQPLNGDELQHEPFAFDNCENQPTGFEIIYLNAGVQYAYGFSFNRKSILSEYLYYWPNGRKAMIFSRINGTYTFRENVREQKTLAGRTPENRLYLVSSNEWNCPQTETAYLWFLNNLKYFSKAEIDNGTTLNIIKKGGYRKEQIVKGMMIADPGICDITISGSEIHPVVLTIHRVENSNGDKRVFALPLSRESMGIQRFFSRIGFWMEALENGTVLLADEIEASMHPLLTGHLIEMFQDPEINKNHAQLIFTTNDTGLLDQSLLRRDQIWFAERNEKTMETDIFALTEFEPRKNENVSKEYLQGRYGAIPFIGEEQR